jgi:hypothetical protein
MSREILNRAVELARNGRYDGALELLRPLVLDEKMKPFALAAMAYTHQLAGDFAPARYLYGRALRLHPDKDDWSRMLARCEDQHKGRIADVRRSKPRLWYRLLGFLFVLAGLGVCALPSFDATAQLVHDQFEFDPTESFTELLIGGAALFAVGLIPILIGFGRKMRYRRALRAAVGRDPAKAAPATCWACGLNRPKRPDACPFCASSHRPPKAALVAPPPLSAASTVTVFPEASPPRRPLAETATAFPEAPPPMAPPPIAPRPVAPAPVAAPPTAPPLVIAQPVVPPPLVPPLNAPAVSDFAPPPLPLQPTPAGLYAQRLSAAAAGDAVPPPLPFGLGNGHQPGDGEQPPPLPPMQPYEW